MSLINATNGAQEWQYGPIKGQSRCVVVEETTAADDHVYVGDIDGWIHKLSFVTGSPLAKIDAGGSVWGLTYADGVLYATAGNTLQAHDPVAGPLWTHAMGDISWGDPVVSNGIVYAGSWDDKLYAIKTGGTSAWISTKFSYFAAEPTVVDGVVYVSAESTDRNEPYLVALDAASGAVLWQAQAPNKAPIVDPVAVGDGRVYAGTGWGAWMCAFDAATGQLQWNVKTDAHPSTPSFWDGRVFVASEHGGNDGYLQAYDAASGALLWTSQTPTGPSGHAVSRPTVDEGPITNYVFVTSQEGYLHAFDRDTGHLAWKAAIGYGGWPNDPTWTDAAGALIGREAVRQFVAIDPLALILSTPVYVKINLPYPPPVEVVAARIRKSVGGRRRKDMDNALSQLTSTVSFVESMQQAIRRRAR
ncbi:MAG: PQQ-binding-like beta-propeller repeat protein [Actinomycetota bacterium]